MIESVEKVKIACLRESIYGVEAPLPPYIYYILFWANIFFNILMIAA
jgi:hypothetical protein